MQSQTSSQVSNLLSGSGAELAQPNILNFDQLYNPQPQIPPRALQEQYKQEPSGQTKAARRFQFTLNKVERWSDFKKYIESLKTKDKALACREIAPSTGHQHIHLFLKMKGPVRLSYKKLCGAHIEFCRGSDLDNWKYITKEDEPEKAGEIIYKYGDRPSEEEDKEKKKKGVTIAEAKEMPLNELEELPLVYYKQVQDITLKKNNEMTGKSANKKVKVLYFYGPSGVGKSIWAKWLFRNYRMDLVKYIGSFWHGVSLNANCAIYDDFRDSHMPPSEFINFIDSTKHSLNLKQGSWKNLYSYIIITSIQHPNDLYPGFQEKAIKNHEEPRRQWMRRMKCVNVEEELKPEKLREMLKDLGLLEEEEEEDNPFADFDFDN